jgi:hypothetical protein
LSSSATALSSVSVTVLKSPPPTRIAGLYLTASTAQRCHRVALTSAREVSQPVGLQSDQAARVPGSRDTTCRQ